MTYLSQQAGGLTDFMFNENPRQSIRDRNWFRVDWNMLAVTSTTQLGRNGTLDLRAFGMISERQTLGFLGKVTQSDPGGRREMIDSQFKNKGMEVRYLHKYTLSEKVDRPLIKGAFVVGGRYYQGKTVTNQGTATDGTAADFEFKNPTDLENSSFTYPSLNGALFAENMLFLGKKLRINFGARIEDISSSSAGYYKRYSIHPFNFDTLAVTTLRDSNSVIRRVPLFGAGISYKLSKNNQIYTSLTQNYRAINFSDIRVNNPNIVIDTAIRDEYGFTAELGWRGLLKEFMIYDVAAFYIFYGDKIGLAPVSGTILRERTNIGDAQNYGLEGFFEINLSKAFNDSAQHQLSIFVNSSYINANYISSKEPNFLDKKVEYLSAIILKTGLKYHYKKLTLQTQYSYNSEQFSDASNSVEPSGDAILGIVPAYYVIDFSGRYQFKNNFSVELGVTNLTNNQYFTRRATGYPGPGILPSDGVSFYTTIQYQFKLKNRH
jgi:Fe(3+) dicitrate transport protein